jgi:hypothetical protein
MNGSGFATQLYLWLLAGAAALIGVLASIVGVLLRFAVKAHIAVDDDFQKRIEQELMRIEDRLNNHIDRVMKE